MAGISIAQEKDLRYSLLILPSALLISCVGISALIEYAKTQKQRGWMETLIIIVLLSSYAMLFPKTKGYLNNGAQTFTGFKEAGQWIKKESSPRTLILASSPRLVRYYSGINFQEFGGNIFQLPADQNVFQKGIKEFQGPVLVETDCWEVTCQPRWLYPISGNGRQYMKNLGFQLLEIIEIEMYGADKIKKNMRVIGIFKRQYAP
ncbi:MAG: hypothetical protein HQL12_07800 [Candidatus Omnitrophica bacterium]|nr:hypothetical protein [Candidatus Omnitrophota bacterium]